jgi:effector-binding domain-containing protein/carbon monoxide dehydrogenase subunit G
MKWFLGLVLVVALITGALYAVGRFLLPNNLQVTRSVTIDRPRASVFAMVNDLQIVKEWSPYYARDPDAEYTFSGDGPGQGQAMHWVSQVRQVGSGRMWIVRSDENQEVEYILELGDRATLNTVMHLTPGQGQAQGTTRVDWAVSADCAPGTINVPCRYMNLVMRGMVQHDLDAAFARLKTLTEQLPNVDFENLNPEIVPVEPKQYVYSPITTANNDQGAVDTAMSMGLDQVNRFMAQYNLTRAGEQVRVTTAWDQTTNTMSFRVGYPFSGPVPGTVVGVQIGQTPSGRALKVIHQGPRSTMRITYAKSYAYLQAHRIPVRQDGLPWEVVVSDGAGDENRTEIYVPLQ